MFDHAKALKNVQLIKAGGEAELSRSQIAAVMFNLQDIIKGHEKNVVNDCNNFYKALHNDRRKELYDLERLMDTYSEIDMEFRRIIRGSSTYDEEIDNLFTDVLRAVNSYLLEKDITGIDHDELYGVMEVSVFASLEYFAWVMLEYDNDLGRRWYRKSLISRSDTDTADHLLEYYDMTQAELEQLSKDIMELDMDARDTIKMSLFGAAFKIIRQICISQLSEETVETIKNGGELAIIEEFFSRGCVSDTSEFEDNLMRMGTFFVAVFMKHIEKTREALTI